MQVGAFMQVMDKDARAVSDMYNDDLVQFHEL
jgi:ketosteroid isomerase-like protein